MLQVGIHHDDRLARGVVHPGGQGVLVAGVSGERDELHPWVVFVQHGDRLRGTIRAAVVHEDDLEVRRQRVELFPKLPVEHRHVRLLV